MNKRRKTAFSSISPAPPNINTNDLLSSSPTSILYLNVCGLTDVKLSALCSSYLDDANPTLLFVSETWYINHSARLANHLVLASTFAPPRKYAFRRCDHGMLLLSSATLSPRIAIKMTTEFSIVVQLDANTADGPPTTTIAAVYLPPSLSPAAVEAELKGLGPVSILMGDFNVRLGAMVGDSVSGPPERLDILTAHLEHANMVHLCPLLMAENGPITRVDHVFASPHITEQCLLAIEKPPIQTDHPMLKLALKKQHGGSPIAATTTSLYDGATKRPCSSLLSNKVMAHLFCQAVQTLCHALEELAQEWNEHDDHHNGELMIELLDAALLDAIKISLEESVGCYDPSNPHHHLAAKSPLSINTMDHGKAVRLFKKTQRMTLLPRNCRLEASNSMISPIEEAVSHYSQLYRCMPYESPTGLAWKSKGCSNEDDPLPNPFESPLAVSWAIQHYPSGKSPGIDGIDGRVMKCLLNAPSFLVCLSRLFTLCHQSGYTPRRWNESIIHPIPKDPSSKSPCVISGCRPISLTVIFRRLFEKILLTTLVPMLSFDRGQAGFRSGFSCLTQALVANEAIHRHRGTSCTNVFIDLKTAYDRVLVSRLLDKLYARKVHPKMVRILASLFSQCSSRIAVNGVLSAPFPRERGLFQGSLLAPWLFNVYIDDLAAKLNHCDDSRPASSEFPPCLLFADDILLQSPDPKALQAMLTKVDRWCHDNGMEVNIAKCAMVASTVHDHGRVSPLPPPLLCNGMPIPVSACYSYLGLPFSKTGLDITAHVSKRCGQASHILSALSSNIATMSWPEAAKLAIYKAFIRPIMEYAAPLIAAAQHRLPPTTRRRKRKRKPPDLMPMLDAVQNKALLWIFNRKSPISVLLSLSGLPSMSLRIEELSSRFLLHLASMDACNPLLKQTATTIWATDWNPIRSPTLTAVLSAFSPASPTPVSVKQYYYEKRLQAFSCSPSILTRYILPECRTRSAMDACLLLVPSRSLRRSIIRWRCNATRLSPPCPTCGSAFLRSHLVRCPDALNAQLTMLGPVFTLSYTNALSTIQGVHNYTPMDHLLNMHMYDMFALLIQC